MGKLRDRLQSIYTERMQIMTPRNCQLVRFNLISKKSAKIIGNLAKKVVQQTIMAKQNMANSMPQPMQAIEDGAPVLDIDQDMLDEQAQAAQEEMKEEEEDLSNYVTVDGVIIKQDFDYLIMEETEVDKYTPLKSATMDQTLWVPYEHDIQVLGYFLSSYYAQVDVEFPENLAGDQAKSNFDIKFLIEGQIELLFFR